MILYSRLIFVLQIFKCFGCSFHGILVSKGILTVALVTLTDEALDLVRNPSVLDYLYTVVDYFSPQL